MNKQKKSSTSGEEFLLNETETFTLPLNELSKKLKTDFETGLTQQDAEQRLQRVGPNIVPKVGVNRLKLYLEPLSNWLIVVYLIASAILAFLALVILPQLWLQLAIWLPIIAGNITIIIVQSIRAERGLTGLQKLSDPKSRVKRDNKVFEIPSENLVPGDIILLKQGDIIPADTRIISSQNLRVNESILSGESSDVEKSQNASVDQKEKFIFQKRNSLFFGTSIASGNATALVLETGKRTQIGKVAGKLKIEAPEVSLRKRINTLAKNLSYLVLIYLGFSITYSAVTLYLNGNLPFVLLIAQDIAKSLIISLYILPLSIPLLVTVVLLAGALFMVKSNVVIRNLNSIESAGRVSVICTDKTGTITENKMTVKWVYTPNKEMEERLYCVTSQDSIFEGKIIEINIDQDFNKAVVTSCIENQESPPVKVEEESSLEYLLAGALLNNDIPILKDDNEKIKFCQVDTSRKVTSDVTDIAMLCLFEKAVLKPDYYRERFEIVKSWPLDPNSKLITKIFKDNKTNRNILFVKGATETLLIKCNRVLSNGNKAEVFNQEYKNHVIERAELFSQLGLRIVSLALREVDNFDQEASREEWENCLTFLGFAAIADPPRVGIRSAVSELKGAGIKPIMITGDSLNTAKSVAKEIGLLEDNQLVLERPQINSLSEQDFLNTAVFARTSPDDKRTIVARYQDLNYVVAMTGDGVNDAQAILAADVGIAMGTTGTDVARQAAGIVLADDSFKSIVTAIRVGRGVFEKIQNIVFFYIAISIAEGLVFFGSSFAREFFLLQTVQLIYLALTQFGPSIALVTDKLSADVMKEKPRSNEGLISGKRRTALIVFALSLAVTLSIAYLLPLNGITPVFEANKVGHVLGLNVLQPASATVWEQAKARTMMISVAIIAQSVLILSLRRLNKPLYKSLKQDWNWRIWPLILSLPLFQVVLMYVPQIQYTFSAIGINFEIIPLVPTDWLIVLALGLSPVALLELTKIILAKRELAKSKSIPQSS